LPACWCWELLVCIPNRIKQIVITVLRTIHRREKHRVVESKSTFSTFSVAQLSRNNVVSQNGQTQGAKKKIIFSWLLDPE